MTETRVVHVLPNASFYAGGLSRAVLPLCQELERQRGLNVELIAGIVGTQTLNSTVDETVSVHIAHYRSKIAAQIATKHLAALEKTLSNSNVEIVHLHSLWLPLISRSLRTAKRHGAKVVLNPHGTLETWSLAWHRRRKRLAMAAYQARDLRMVDGFVATSDEEAASIRSLGLTQPIAVVPNGVVISSEAHSSICNISPKRHFADRKTLLFLGRIHPIKGLVNLIHAWAVIRPDGWALQVAGVDNGGHQAELRRLVDDLGLTEDVSFYGPVLETEKSDVYLGSDAFVLPSYSENFGIVVAEALAHGLPVIATRGTPWRSLQEQGCGWWVEPTSEGLANAIHELAVVNPSQYCEMSRRALSLAHEFAWPGIAVRMSDFYSRIMLDGH